MKRFAKVFAIVAVMGMASSMVALGASVEGIVQKVKGDTFIIKTTAKRPVMVTLQFVDPAVAKPSSTKTAAAKATATTRPAVPTRFQAVSGKPVSRTAALKAGQLVNVEYTRTKSGNQATAVKMAVAPKTQSAQPTQPKPAATKGTSIPSKK